jgi:hypothetical protein
MRFFLPAARAATGVAVVSTLALTACGDVLQPDRVIAGIEFEESVVTVTEGEPITLRPVVVDQDGRPFDVLPIWTEFDWTSSNPGIFNPGDPALRAGQPGQASATVRFAGLAAQATVRVNPSSMQARIPHAYLVQAVQRRDGTVPMVAGRPATLRVFATGDVVNFFQPEAVATFYRGDEELGTRRIGLTAGGAIPRNVNEGHFESSWVADVPASWVQPGLSFKVELDPDAAFPLNDRSQARFPLEGTRPVDVRELPDMEIRFVPVHQNRSGSTGALTGGPARWTQYLEDVFPIGRINRDVRATFYTDAGSSGTTDWGRIINEVKMLRVLDDDDRFYYGVLRRHSDYAGLGYVGYPVAIGWDDMRIVEGDNEHLAYTTFAHELGHNFGRRHAPACDAGNPDPAFPYPGGVAGVYGLHHTPYAITLPTVPDLMGYCRPHWVSDYTYEAVLRYRLELEAERRRWDLAGAPGPGLLVWGDVQDGRVRLEPAIAAERVRPTVSHEVGPVIEGFDAQGTLVFRHVATTMEPSHGPAGAFAFSAVVPLDQARMERVASIRVAGGGVPETTRRGTLARAPERVRDLAAGRAPAFGLETPRRGPSEVVWDAATYPLLVVREAATGTVVAFARQGRLDLPIPAHQLRFDLSDGVRSVPARPEIR